ncbi:MAG: formylglycine-generating enzyme family protein [Treponema sp.]|nr:formylglycine-generating enzyme family protein [Treponema sp.]
MKKLPSLLTLMLLMGVSLAAQVQPKPALVLLPFTDQTGGDEETIIILLANLDSIRNAFTMVPTHTNFNGLITELQSQEPANPEGVKNALYADFAVTVHTERLAEGNLVLINIVNTGTLQVLAGDYRKYGEIKDLRTPLPDIAQKILNATQIPANKPTLAILPFYTPAAGGVDTTLLTRLLTIDLANTEKYAVVPWALTTGTERGTPSGIIDGERIKAIGTAANVQYVLTGDALNLRATNLVMGFILNAANADIVSEGELEYTVITGELDLIPEFAAVMTGTQTNDTITHIGTHTENTGNNLVRIEPGVFTMGSPGAESFRDPDEIEHQVMMSGFYMGRYEVTQEEYEALMGTNPSEFKDPELPVERVSWFDAVRYCNARSERERLTPAYTISETEIIWIHNANGYRLPTEAEWEYACRAGTTTVFNTGNNLTVEQGNYDGNYPYEKNPAGIYRNKTTPAGSFTPNAWGLYDMHGNVYEWCWDQYKTAYNSADLNGSINADAVIRGGSWYSEARFLRSANRAHAAHTTLNSYIGFRVVRSSL